MFFNTIGNWFPLFNYSYPFNDQSMFNVFIHSEPFRKMGLDVIHFGRGSNISSVFNWRDQYTSSLPVKFKDGRMPVVVHQIYRLGSVFTIFNRACDSLIDK